MKGIGTSSSKFYLQFVVFQWLHLWYSQIIAVGSETSVDHHYICFNVTFSENQIVEPIINQKLLENYCNTHIEPHPYHKL